MTTPTRTTTIAEIDVPGSGWIPYELISEGEPLDENNLAIIPLCPDNPGSVGWLDFGCGNLANHIENPCNAGLPDPVVGADPYR